jgi:hypothetical protein
MAKAKKVENDEPSRKPLVWLQGEVKTPPFTAEGRQEAGTLLRMLQEGQRCACLKWNPCPTWAHNAEHFEFEMPSTTGGSCIALTLTRSSSWRSIRRRHERYRMQSSKGVGSD